ncbi:MAG: hypothetical protein HGA90_06350 [Alphaproteobacteria bacterium]|nr:hypothetical protein [Alphaproteobacteria bacterium]
MTDDQMRYDLLIENALREVVRQTLARVIEKGLPGNHHFYISFLTHHPAVEVPAYLKEKYPEEMTIVLQHQFFGLRLDEAGFSVMLSFNNVRERLNIPFAAITSFVDPSVNFALQFQVADESSAESDDPDETGDAKADKTTANAEKPKEEKRGEVISLDKFRKK